MQPVVQTFKTLLLREWMQHRFGWLLLGGIPLAIMIPLMIFGTIEFGQVPPPPGMMALMFTGGYVGLLMALAGGSVAIQTPGLARRDVQDRSIEFWLSLPTSHSASIGATLVSNWLLMPLMVLGMALAGGMVAALIAVVRVHGAGGLGQLHWGELVMVLGLGGARLALGVVLAMLWVSPLLMGAMVSSVGLKRWGVPLFGAVVGIGGLILDKVYHQPVVLETVADLFTHFIWAVLPSHLGTLDMEGAVIGQASLAWLPGWLRSDALMVLGDLGSPLFAGAMAVSAGCFALLVWLRSRGG